MSEAASWQLVCPLGEIVPNTGVAAKVGDEQVAIFRLTKPSGEEDGVYAISNLDPRSGANVISRGLVGDIGGEIVVASPLYKNHFSLVTGRCIEDEAWSVRPYAVRVTEDGVIEVRPS
jgi:nitrite reductase (NADH) small subunit